MNQTYLTESKFYLVSNSLKKRKWISSSSSTTTKPLPPPTLVWLNTKRALSFSSSSKFVNHVSGLKSIVYKSDLAKTLMSFSSRTQFLSPPGHALNDPVSFLRFQRDFVVLCCFSLSLTSLEKSEISRVSIAAMDILQLKSSLDLFTINVPSSDDMIKYSLFLKTFGTSMSILSRVHSSSSSSFLVVDKKKDLSRIIESIKSKIPKALLSSENIWILKPGASSKGNNIRVLRDFTEIVNLVQRCQVKKTTHQHQEKNNRPHDGFVAMRYIERPMLFPPKTNRKFDLRRWILIHSISSSEIGVYMLTDSYARVCSTTYDTKTNNRSVHLTNPSVQLLCSSCSSSSDNKKERDPFFTKPNKSIPHQSFLMSHSTTTKQQQMNKNDLIHPLSDVLRHFDEFEMKRWNEFTLVQTRFCVLETIRAYSKRLSPRDGMFELLGFDFLIDEFFRPWILEVNVSPDMDSESALAKKLIMEHAIEGLFQIVLDGAKSADGWECLGRLKCG
jgi:hypothetical protein